MIIGFMYWYKC